MGKNLSQIRERAKSLILDLPDEITNAVVDEWVQKAQKELEDRHGFPPMIANHAATTTVGTRKLDDLPGDWARERAKPYYYVGTGRDTLIEWIVDEENLLKLYQPYDPENDGSPEHILIDEDAEEFHVYPLPDGAATSGSLFSDGEYRVVLPYWKRLSTLTADGDTNWFTNNMSAYLEFFAASEGALFNRDREEFLELRALADAEARKAITTAKKKRAMQTRTLRPRRDVRASVLQERMR